MRNLKSKLPFQLGWLLLLVVVLTSFTPANTGTIEIRITGTSNSSGNLAVTLFNSSQGFPSDASKAMLYKIVPVNGSSQTVVFDNISYGTYAVAIMHDENKNGKLDTNLFGIPQEGVGVSNNALGTFSAPVFDECAFLLQENRKIVNISLEYW